MQGRNPIPRVDFGGEGPSFHFAHANAYTPGSYRQYLQPLREQFHVWAMAQRPLWPGERARRVDVERVFVDDLIRALEETEQGAVIGAGHSLGAWVSMLAAVARPDLFRALVLLEPVLLPPHVLQAVRANPDLAASTPMVQRARNRRNRWASRREAFEHYRGKAVFRRLSDEVLWDYVDEGLVETPEGDVTLRFPRDWEAEIYSQPPTTVWDVLPQVSLPTLAVRGEHSDTLQPEAWQRWQRLQPAAHFVEIPGCGHLAPFEEPAQVSEVTRDFLARVLQ